MKHDEPTDTPTVAGNADTQDTRPAEPKKELLSRRQMLGVSSAGAAVLAGAALMRNAHAQGGQKKQQPALPQVPRRVLGKTKAEIPILLFGAAVKLNARFDPKLAEAVRFGVNYIDAADCYNGGSCELAVASYVRKAKNRKDLWITSKSDDHDVEGFQKTLGQTLRQLDSDYVDMYYLHALREDKYLTPELARTVDKLKKAGKIRHFGFSCHHGSVVELLQKAAELPWIDSVMFRYNFRQYGNKELNKAMDAAHKSGVGLIAMKTQGSEASFRNAWRKFEQTGKWNKYQAVLKAVWEDERITAAVSSMDTLDKLRENIAAALNKEKLSEAEHQAIERYSAATRGMTCDGCDHICNARVDAPVRIGDTMRYLMYHDVYGEEDKARRLFKTLPQASQRLSSVDFRAAASACPHGVDVVAHMERASRIFGA